jgi:uncharacterized coiled-coil protein SlyX
MERPSNYVPHLAILLAVVTVGVLTKARRERGGMGASAAKELKCSLAELEGRLVAQEQAAAARFMQIDARLDEHATKLAEIPSTARIVAAVEQLLSKNMVSLDERLTAQAASIEVLKTTVAETDSVLERLLKSKDSLQVRTDAAELSRNTGGVLELAAQGAAAELLAGVVIGAGAAAGVGIAHEFCCLLKKRWTRSHSSGRPG